MTILVTGGAGYIGSHTCVELLNSGYDVIVIDNFCNSKKSVLDKVYQITGKKVKLYENDVCDVEALTKIFEENKIDAVIHFAGLKAVGESVEKPLLYYRNNLDSTLSLCEVMSKYNCKKLVFSSSATVYGAPAKLPITEDMPLSVTNPYGATKLFIERILEDLYVADPSFSIALMQYIVKVATGELEELKVFGNDYNTVDGTGVRDYIHVVDLAKGHVKAIEKVLSGTGVDAYNLGPGEGYSVLQIVDAFEKGKNLKINYKIVGSRPGDIDACYSDPSKAYNILHWKANLTLDDMVKSAYNFAKKNK